MARTKTKVAVLGGGIGGLVAAYELSKTKKLRKQYEVTLYQMGWRLGGKGASGRNTSPEGFDRVEEHGLHIWLGNYQNAFLLMKDCYDHCFQHDLMPHSPLRRWQDAFKKHGAITLMEHRDGEWSPWQLLMPPMEGWPGEAEQCLNLEGLISQAVDLLAGVRDEAPVTPAGGDAVSPLAHLDAACEVCQAMQRQATKQSRAAPGEYDALLTHLRGFHHGFRAAKQARIERSDVERRRWILIDLATTLLRGVLVDVLIPGHESLSILDDEDFRDWLARHGAEPQSIDSAAVRNAYEIVFGYAAGDERRPSFAAGTAVRFLLRWVGTYRGGFLYKMQAGMGDIVFSPLYLTLKDRGVRFQFFHRVQSLHLDAEKKNVSRIRMAQQVRLTVSEYAPLVEVKGIPSWPAAPLYQGQVDASQAAAVEALKQQYPGLEPLESAYSPWTNHGEYDLQQGTDFDKVVLAIPVGALPEHCAELIEANSRFGDMVRNVGTVATQSFQLWMNRDQHQLGWQAPEPAILDSYRDSYADFSQLISRENHPEGSVQNIAYLCKTLSDQGPIPPAGPDPSYETNAHQRVKLWSRDVFLNGPEGMRPIWPQAYQPHGGDLRWDWLTDQRAAPGSGPDRFDAQYWCANVNPSDRYVQALTGTTKFRLKAEESGFDNLVMAGDWIKTGVDAGCIEGATLGGMQAARAISGLPKHISGEADFCDSERSGCLTAILGWLMPVFDFFRCVGRCLRGVGQPSPGPHCTSVKPPFVERGGEPVAPQPYLFQDCQLHGFVLEADYMSLKTLCDKHLNDPSHHHVEYWPAIGRVVLARLDVAKAQPETPGEYDFGYIREGDVSFIIPVVAFDGLVPIGVAAFVPYLYVDHPWGVLAGREVYGLNKIPSYISPIAPDSATLFSVQTYAVQTAGTGTEVPQQPVFSIVSDTGSPVSPFASMASLTREGRAASPAAEVGDMKWKFQAAEEAWEAILKLVFKETMRIEIEPRGAVFDVRSFLSDGAMPMVTLKQFRDSQNGRFACYQAITEMPTQVTGFTGASPITDPLHLHVESLVSQPLLSDFGWTSADIPVREAWQMAFSFRTGNGKELWRA